MQTLVALRCSKFADVRGGSTHNPRCVPDSRDHDVRARLPGEVEIGERDLDLRSFGGAAGRARVRGGWGSDGDEGADEDERLHLGVSLGFRLVWR